MFALFYTAASGDARHPGTFQRNFDTRGGAQAQRLVGGSQLLAIKLARRLAGDVVLESPVRRIVQHGSAVTVVGDRGSVSARRAIVAVAPALAGRIDYEPILPFQRDQLTQRYGQGTLTKVAAVYDRPFWRDKGLSGFSVSTGFPIGIGYDDSPPGGRPGVMFGFVGGDSARRYGSMSAADRRGAALKQLRELFGPEAGASAPVLRDQLERAAVDPRLPGRDPGGRLVGQLRAVAAASDRAHPLGRDRDRHLLERLYGRRDQLRPPCRTRGALRAVTANSTATVREATFDLLRAHGMTTIFGNPGSTELPMLADFPDDFTYVLGLQELVVVGMADGYAQATGRPTHVNLHTAPGVGNAVGGIFNAQANKSPLVITAGQQVRPQITIEANLTNRDAVLGPQPYVKWAHEPPRAVDVPGAIARAIHHAMLAPRGPAFVSIPMDDWTAQADPERTGPALARRVTGRQAPDPGALAVLAERLAAARAPALVAGPDVDATGGWHAAVELAEKQRLPVWASPATGGSRLGFPEDHPNFVGILPPAIGPLGHVLAD